MRPPNQALNCLPIKCLRTIQVLATAVNSDELICVCADYMCQYGRYVIIGMHVHDFITSDGLRNAH